MADASTFSTIIPAVLASIAVTTWMMSRQKKLLDKTLRELLAAHFPAIELQSVDAANVSVRVQGRPYIFPANALWKEAGRKQPRLLPLLETELVRATGQTAESLRQLTPQTPGNLETLQLDRVETAGSTGVAVTCATCSTVLSDQYFELNGQVGCSTCKDRAIAVSARKTDVGSVFRAILYGSIAAAIGCVIYYAIRAATGYEIGLVAIVVGLMVGAAVRKASGGRGGKWFQGIAVFLTYSAIVINYTPDLFKAIKGYRPPAAEKPTAATSTTTPPPLAGTRALAPAVPNAAPSQATPPPAQVPQATADKGASAQTSTLPDRPANVSSPESGNKLADRIQKLPPLAQFIAGLLIMIGVVFAIPFLGGAQNLIGLLIIGFALYEAWKLNKKALVTVAGPFKVGSAGSSPAPSTGPGSST
jgi:hypothetical protein